MSNNMDQRWIKLAEIKMDILRCPNCNKVVFVPRKIIDYSNVISYEQDISKAIGFICEYCNSKFYFPD